jgi:hypothetical protein
MKLFKYTFLFLSMTISAQTGKYVGLKSAGSSQTQRKSSDISVWKENYTEKILILKSDSTFSFEFEWPSWAAQIPMYRCIGKWTKVNDTLILNSKFKSKDFIDVKESYTQTYPSDVVILIFTSTKGYFNAELNVNDKRIGSYQFHKDTLYYKCKNIESIFLTLNWPASIERKFQPKDKKSNTFIFTIQPKIEDDNMYFENSKLVFKNGEFKPLTQKGPLDVDKNYKLKKCH